MHKKFLYIFFICCLLNGCATSPYNKGVQALNSGDYSSAQIHFDAAIAQGNVYAWNEIGKLHEKQGSVQTAINSYIIGARMGSKRAIESLQRLNIPIPPQDLLSAKKAWDDHMDRVYAGQAAASMNAAITINTIRSSAPSSLPANDPKIGNAKSSLMPINTSSNITINKSGNTITSSNGASAIINGNLITTNSGDSYIRSGNTITGTNGTSAIQVGNTTYINQNNIQRTCQTLGSIILCN